MASVAAGDKPVEGTMPPIAGFVETALDGEPEEEGEDAEEDDDGPAGETDFAVSVVLFDPTVETVRGIFAAPGGLLGAKTLAALGVVGVAGAAVGGAEMVAPCVWVLPIPATVGIPGTPVPKTGDVGSA